MMPVSRMRHDQQLRLANWFNLYPRGLMLTGSPRSNPRRGGGTTLRLIPETESYRHLPLSSRNFCTPWTVSRKRSNGLIDTFLKSALWEKIVRWQRAPEYES